MNYELFRAAWYEALTETGMWSYLAQPTQGLAWEREVLLHKWTNFYTRVLARFATQADLKLRVRFEVKEGVSQKKVDETRVALRELGLGENRLQSVE